MSVTPIGDPRKARLRKRIADLKALRASVDDELLVAEAAMRDLNRPPTRRRARGAQPPCGTDAGYHWHRYHEAETNWPLPEDDPCGCRAAHTREQRLAEAKVRISRRMSQGREQRVAR